MAGSELNGQAGDSKYTILINAGVVYEVEVTADSYTKAADQALLEVREGKHQPATIDRAAVWNPMRRERKL